MAPGPRHLKAGDSLPPLKPGVLRLYSMKFCPFAERTRLVLHAKGIEHEVININTWEKPTWFVEKNPKKLVPVLEQDDKIVYESLIACQYLEDIYPDKNPLIPKDPYLRAKDAILLDFFGDKVMLPFYGAKNGVDKEKVETLRNGLQHLDEDLQKRGTDFFYGSKPGYLDYMIWPVFARMKAAACFGEGQGIPSSLTALTAWVDRMLQDSSVQSIIHPDSAYIEWGKHYRTENTMFDEIETPN
ncbi:Glutathione S-transferase omega-1 [Holothuria leucospilota]|uniref:Glutathione S-transferase omega n=1 Tax=Holothuria leucospilota TaxID=206669 RepID=A0A9Q1C070_HOLLE|nr:Glutathione S-transferase omega-1 [Holothuria leucospilota]